ncbi:acyl-CoA synthetase [Natronococcus wangiae]|uniref:acyl-CoA synthetase n=1 Tax=Natronococcus wangiae TaxID=3068275 RepID=UPI00273DBD21|nr:AMP-binding protein [Natronococcus sp. AD5]
MTDEVPSLDTYHLHEQQWESYEHILETFEWQIPDQFNIADYVCDRWATDQHRVALYADSATGDARKFTYADLQKYTDQLAAYLRQHGVDRGTRIGVNLPQKPEAAIAHIAAWKVGAISVPLSTLFGPEGLEYRLKDSDADVCIVDQSNIEAFRAARPASTTATLIVGEVEHRDVEVDFWEAITGSPSEFDAVRTEPEDDAIIMYTSGTTGLPKGVLHGHQVLLGHLPAFVVTNSDLKIGLEEVYWSPSEWAWIATLFDLLFPALFFGKSALVYYSTEFDPRKAFSLLDDYEVTKYLAPPTALRKMMQVDSPATTFNVESVDTIVSGGEAVGSEIDRWIRDVFDDTALNENYGQTEANAVIGECTALESTREGTMGRQLPGHEVRVLDPETLTEVNPGTVGEIALRYETDPVCFKKYWKNRQKTAEKIQDVWLLTGDLGTCDKDGYFTFHSRKDDVIISAGYRIGPEEIEETLTTHSAVAEAGVIGIPDDERSEVPKAFVVLTPDRSPTESLKENLQRYVKDRLAKYEYPREIEVLDELPMTVTGKVQRSKLKQRETDDKK